MNNMENVEKVLAHYGVKGMKWGQRKNTSPTAVEVTAKSGKLVKTSGGKNQPASDDAVKAAVAKQKAKSSSLDALTNQELQVAVQRMNLEQQYIRLSTQPRSTNAGARFVKNLVNSVAKTQVTQIANQTATKKVSDVMKDATK